MKKFLLATLAGIAVFGTVSNHARAADSSREIRELQSTVQALKTLVEQQTQRITELEKKQNTSPATQAAQVEVKPTTESQPTPETRQLGFWKVPTPSGTAWKMLPDISVIGAFSGAYFSREPEGEVGHDPGRTGFNLQEIEISFQSVIDPYVRADVFLAFHEDGVEVEEAYVTSLSLPKGLQLRGGQFLMPFGRQNQKHLDTWAFVDNALANQRLLGAEQFRELGIELSYLFPTPFFLQSQVVVSQGENEDNFDGERKGDFAYTARLSGSTDLTPNLTLLAGASAAFGFNGTGRGNATQLWGGDLLLKWKPSPYQGIEWQSEYLFRHRDVGFDSENEGGFYSYLNGNWSKRWGAGLRVDYLGLPRAENRALQLSPMLTFRPTEFFRLRLQYNFTDEKDQTPAHAAFFQWIFNIGPHGAHQF